MKATVEIFSNMHGYFWEVETANLQLANIRPFADRESAEKHARQICKKHKVQIGKVNYETYGHERDN